MIKPCIGLTPEKTAELAYETALGGVDVIKDDELVQDPPFLPTGRSRESRYACY